MAKKFAYLLIGIVMFIYAYEKFFMPRRCCKCWVGGHLASISIVTRGTFLETIPQTGRVTDNNNLIVTVDKLYRQKIKLGLPATAYINNTEVRFKISHIDTSLIDSRFFVQMDFADTTITLKRDTSVRLRILLSESREATILPMGGFYKDTGGTWVYVTKDEKHFVKRNIKLGVNNSDSFMVLEGLQPGEKVLTSSYQNFRNKEEVSLWEIELKKPVSMM